MRIINIKLYSKNQVFICVKFKNNYSQIYSLTNEIKTYHLNTKKKIINHILKLYDINVKKIYLYKVYDINKYNQKHINSCKKLN